MSLQSFRAIFKKSIPLISQFYHVRPFKNTDCCLKKSFSRPPGKFSKIKRIEEIVDDEENISKEDESWETEYSQLVDRAFRIPEMGHNVFVIQPYIKWGAEKKRNTTPELQLAESCALIKTLNHWTVADQTTISLMTLDKTTVFGKGNLEKLEEKVFYNKNISAIFVSIDILKGVQREFLESLFKVPVYDRYSIVIQIFREHAVSREAKLQLRLAELPYLRGRMKYLEPNHHHKARGGENYLEFQRNLLKEKERKIKQEVESLRNQRDVLRKKRRSNNLPVVAVVGYTNSGKTSLIKALTNEETIMPKDVLFATLDVTVHAGQLPSGLKVLFVDTIGFISDIPTTLIQSFVATLEDALLADVIVHVRDISHPDAQAQMDHVQKTLENLNLDKELMENVIEVANKADLVTNIEELSNSNAIITSAIKLQGLDELKDAMEAAILNATGRKRLDIRVRSGGEEYKWLLKEATVSEIRADATDPQYSLLHVIISPHVLAKFTHTFIKSSKRS